MKTNKVTITQAEYTELKKAKERDENTLWRLTEEDFLTATEDLNLSPAQKAKLFAQAKESFNIDDWQEYVQAYIAAWAPKNI